MHRVPAFVLLASIAACASSTPTAPSRVAAENGSIVARAGDPVVDGSFLVPYENRWKITVTLADGRPRDAGTWTDRLERVTVDARPMLRRTQRESELVTDEDVHPGLAAKIGGDRLEVTRINVFDPKTVAPVTSELLTNVKRGSRAQFSGGRVRVEKSIGDAPPIVKDQVSEERRNDIEEIRQEYLPRGYWFLIGHVCSPFASDRAQ